MSTIESVLHETRIFAPSTKFVEQANLADIEAYRALCAEAERDYPAFWSKLAQQHILWHKPFTRALNDSEPPFFKWFEDGELNISYNCLDRHLTNQPDKIAIIFEADNGDVNHCTYRELYQRVCQFANGLKALDIKRGSRHYLYADAYRSGDRHASMRPHRRHSLGRIRRILRKEFARAYRRRGCSRGDHR